MACKKAILLNIFCCIIFSLGATNLIPFDFDWKFMLGDYPSASQPEFDDSHWRLLNIPHDWSIEGAYHENKNQTDWQSGYLPCGVAWYRKDFYYDNSWDDKETRIHFDGVYMNSSVWINGIFLGKRPYGYIGFEYDLTPFLVKGKNVISVQVDHSNPLSARWYTGSGIYRHVWLIVDNKIHIPTWGIYYTTIDASPEKATIQVNTNIVNHSTTNPEIEVKCILQTKHGEEVASSTEQIVVNSRETQEITQQISFKKPSLWSPDHPVIYILKVMLIQNETVIGSKQLFAGIRKGSYSNKGYELNGNLIHIKGVCDHHTAGALGAAIPDQALERRLKILKSMGCNAIRTAHNPFSPEFYTICDTLGFIVMNEAFDGWEKPKARDDYGNYFKTWWKKDLTDFVLRDRNHPSVLFWSIGNEVSKATPETQKKLVDLIHSLDATRPVTQGGTDPTRGMSINYDQNFRYLDIVGFNGNGEEVGELEKFQEQMPDKIGIGTEIPHTYQTRGVYRTKTAWRRRNFPAPWELKKPIAWKDFKHRVFHIADLSDTEVFPEESQHVYYQSSYDNASVRISARKSWQRSTSFPWLLGEFRWGSFDYLGEAEWPQRCGNFGVIDLCGFPKDHYYLYQSLWTSEPMVHILPHWTHPGKERIAIPVVVYTNCEQVELFLNGKSLGEQKYEGEQLVWQVPYEKGTIKAIGKVAQKAIVEKSQTTAETAERMMMRADKIEARANQTDVIHIELDIVDEKGVMCPMADNDIRFDIVGPARLIAVDNGDPIDRSPYKIPQRKAFRGKAFLIVQTTKKEGKVIIKASSPGLKPASISIDVN